MAARIMELADAGVVLLGNRFPFIAPDKAQRAWVPTLAVGPKGKFLPGRQVYFCPAGYGQAGVLDGSTDLYEYRFEIVVVEQWPQAGSGTPPTEWVDERVEYLESLENLFGDVRSYGDNAGELYLFGTAYPETCTITELCDPDYLRQFSAYVGVIELALREGNQ